MPSLYVDQALESIPRLYPKYALIAQRRSADIGEVLYSLLEFKKDAAVDAVTIEGAAVFGPDAWVFTATCASANAIDGLATTLERVAALALRPPAGSWSAAVQGVRGRLIATPVFDAGRRQVRLEIELENVNDFAKVACALLVRAPLSKFGPRRLC